MGLGLIISEVTDEKELIRLLAKFRLRSDLQASAKGITPNVVDGLMMRFYLYLKQSL